MTLDREKIVPLLKTTKDVLLYPVDGDVYSVWDFVQKHQGVLSQRERIIVNENRGLLSRKKLFEHPFASNKEVNNKKSKPLKAISVGSRSVLIKEDRIKLKGCRMHLNSGVCFPHEQLNFGDTKMVTTEIPFGVLTSENVMREILAFCFFKQKKIAIGHTPLSVFEYRVKDRIAGYALVSKTKNEQRLESSEHYEDLTIKELIIIKEREKRMGKKYVENEPSFGVDRDWHARQKSTLLIKMNFNGGFRGVLNSNFGNDIVFNHKLYICDFDTFTVIGVPSRPNEQYIRSFVLWCVIEVLKTSPVILDFLNTDGMTRREISENLWEIYSAKSSLWKQYHTMFMREVKKRKWNVVSVGRALEDARKTEVFYEMILDNVINSKVIKETYPPTLSFYTPQGMEA